MLKTKLLKQNKRCSPYHINYPNTRDKYGFTLFELLIAIFIGTILIMSGAYAIRMGLFSMEKDEVWFNNSTKEKAAFDFFWQQVSSLRIQKIPTKKDQIIVETIKKKKTIYFTGKKDSLTFITPLSLKKRYGQGLIIANYKARINENGLWDLTYTENTLNPSILIKLSEDSDYKIITYESNSTVFLKDCSMISFSYLINIKKDINEQPDIENNTNLLELNTDVIEGTNLKWKEELDGKTPRAIKFTVSKNGKEQELVSPVMAMYSFLAYGQ